MTDVVLFEEDREGGPGRLRVAVDGFLLGVEVPGPMGEHLRLLADVLDGQAAGNRVAARYGNGVPSGVLMAQMQASREFREAFAAVLRVTGGGQDDDPASRLLAELAAPLVGHTPGP